MRSELAALEGTGGREGPGALLEEGTGVFVDEGEARVGKGAQAEVLPRECVWAECVWVSRLARVGQVGEDVVCEGCELWLDSESE